MRPIGDILALAATLVSAAVIGFGVPAGWVWIGSQMQGGTGATQVNFSVAMAILFGIIITYVAILYLAGWLVSRFSPQTSEPTQRGTARSPWMRGTTDTKALRPRNEPQMSGLERVFVYTTLIVTAAAFVWFFFFAEGGGLPSP